MNTLVQHLLNELSYSPQNPVIFNSGLFLFLFVAFSAVYYLLRNRDTARILFVTLFSYYFYYKSSGFYFLLLGLVVERIAGCHDNVVGLPVAELSRLLLRLGVDLLELCR